MISRKPEWRVALAAVLFILSGCGVRLHPSDPGVNQVNFGYLRTGGKFGVNIGQDRIAARQALGLKKIYFWEEVRCDQYVAKIFKCRGDLRIDYFITKWPVRRGSIFLEISPGGKVEGIAWDVYLFSNVDL